MLRAALTFLVCHFSIILGAEKNVALVIGNSSYSKCPELANPQQDAELIATHFKSAGYLTTTLKNATLEQMLEALNLFYEQSKGANIATIFYAGHGIEVERENYLLPTDADIVKTGDQHVHSVSLSKILKDMENLDVQIKLIILDCCRDNPFGTQQQKPHGGMVAVDESRLSLGTMLVYSGKPGLTVPDGPEGGNSPFVQALDKQFGRSSGHSCMDVFSNLGDFIESPNKHWVKIDNDGSTLASLTRTPLFKQQQEVKPPTEVKSIIPEGFHHHRSDRAVALYHGTFEGDQAYFALSFSDETKFSGYSFTQEGGKIQYLTGNRKGTGAMEVMFWQDGKQERFARLQKQKGKDNAWEGTTNLAKIQFSRPVDEVKPSSQSSEYEGSLGVDQATLEMKWSDELSVNGKLTIDKVTRYRLVGDNSYTETIFANVYDDLKHQGVILLKKSKFKGVSWNGICYFNSGEKKLLSVICKK